MGFALDIAQCGGKHSDAKPLKGFSGTGVLEIVETPWLDKEKIKYRLKLAGQDYHAKS